MKNMYIKKGVISKYFVYRSTCITDGEDLIRQPADHGLTTFQVGDMEARMRTRVVTEPTSVKRVYDDISREVLVSDNSEDLATRFPRFDSIQSSLYR